MTGISKYCTIADLQMLDADRHLVNCVINRSGATLEDYDVIRSIEGYISKASTEFEAVLRRYTDMPIAPTVTALTGNFVYVRGDVEVTIVGGAALAEISVGDEIRPDDNEDIRFIVVEVTNNTEIVIDNVYYGESDLTSASSKYVPNIPKEVKELVRDHTSWLIWSRTTEVENNPRKGREADYQRALIDIKKGEYRFTTVGGQEVKTIPSLTDTTVEKVMTEDNLEDYTLDPDSGDYGEWRDF